MENNFSKWELRDALAYDIIHNAGLTIGERICINQYIGLGIAMSESLLSKVTDIVKSLRLKRWENPEKRYVFSEAHGGAVLEYYNVENEQWLTVPSKRL